MPTTTRDLIERRASLTADLRAISDAPEGDNGDLSEAQETRWSDIRKELEAVEKRIARAEALDAAERRAAGSPADTTDPMAIEMPSYSLTRALAHSAGLDVDAGREIEVSQELARRENRAADGLLVPVEAMAPETRAVTSGGASGGDLIATDHSTMAIDRLRANLATARLGVTVMGGLRGNVEIPRLASSSDTAWVAENSPIPESDPDFDAVTLSPKHVASLTSYSRNLLLQSSPQVEGLMRRDLAAQVAEAIDLGTLAGTGGVQPTGILNTAGVTAIDTIAAAITEDDILALIAALEEGNAMLTGYAVSTGAGAALRSARDGDGKLLGTLTGTGNSATMLNTPASVTTQMPTFVPGSAAVIAGDWSDALVGMWGAVEIMSNPYADQYFNRGNVGIRAIATCDVAVRRPGSFKVLNLQ